MKFFEGCTALITGASSGLGVEFARQLAPSARALVLVARRSQRLESLRQELLGSFPSLEVRVYVADLRNEPERVALADWLSAEGIRINLLVNNAGLGDQGPFETAEWQRLQAILEVNVMALTHLTRLLVPAMSQRGRSAILNVSSVASFFPLPNTAVYAASKAYVTSLSEALGIELRSRGIIVTALCPGPVPTEFSSVALRSPGEVPHHESMPAFVVTAQRAVREGLEAVAHGRARVIPGTLLWISVAAGLMVPFFITRRILRLLRSRL